MKSESPPRYWEWRVPLTAALAGSLVFILFVSFVYPDLCNRRAVEQLSVCLDSKSPSYKPSSCDAELIREAADLESKYGPIDSIKITWGGTTFYGSTRFDLEVVRRGEKWKEAVSGTNGRLHSVFSIQY